MKRLIFILGTLGLVACQQNPFPQDGYLRREPLKKPEMERFAWSGYGIRCIEASSSTSHGLRIQNADPVPAQITVEIFPVAARPFVKWKSDQLEILSDSADVTGYHRFHVVATASHENIQSSSSEEMFVYYVTSKNCPSEIITDDQIRAGGL